MSYTPPQVVGDITYTTLGALDIMGATFSFSNPGSTAYPLANLALYVPFSVSRPVTAYEGWVVTGTTGGGNFDIGIYSAAGSRINSSGSTARSASTVNNTTALTDTLLIPGVRYYMAFAADGTNNYQASTAAAGINEAMGVLESTSSFALPASPTLSRTTRAYVPRFGLNLYTVAL